MDENGQLLYLRATVAYDGAGYLGFQCQAKGHTVQGALEATLGRIARRAVRVVGAGRTDSGVHAQGQVIGFELAWRHSLAELQRALNAELPEDIVVLDVGPAEPGWHPRFSARRRHYRYTILNQPLRSPLERRHACHVAAPLDVPAMQAAARCLEGVHDFAAFGRPAPDHSAERIIYSATWQASEPWLIFDIVGNAFLRGMVRRLVGSMLQVGLGAWPAGQLQAVLESRKMELAAPPALACGLCLMRVEYE